MDFSVEDVLANVHFLRKGIPASFRSESRVSGGRKSVLRGDDEFVGLKIFDPGNDDFRRLALNSPGFNGDVLVRDFRAEQNKTILLLVKVSSSIYFRFNFPAKAKLLLETVGVLARTATEFGDSVGLCCFSDEIVIAEKPRRVKSNYDHFVRLVYEYLGSHVPRKRLFPDFSNSERLVADFQAPLEHALSVLKTPSIVIIITDMAGCDTIDSDLLKNLTDSHDVLFVILDDPREFLDRRRKRFEWFGRVQIRSMETGQLFSVWRKDLPKIRKRIETEISELQADLERFGAGFVTVDYKHYLDQLSDFFEDVRG